MQKEEGMLYTGLWEFFWRVRRKKVDLRRGPMGWGGGIFYENFYHKILLRGGGGVGRGGEGFGEGILAAIGVIL